MKQFVLFISLVLIGGCVPKTNVVETTPSNIKSSAPYLWSDNSFPRTIHISSNFSTSEVQNITAMTQAWTTSVQSQKTFFSIAPQRTSEITNSLNSMDSLLDSVLGIYRTTRWPPSLPGSALAVTQIYGRRYNAGTENEFVNIEHADILVNFDIHRFDTADSGPNYDLRTVLLHEFGHFLGLGHKSVYAERNESVMYPSISSSEAKRFPTSIDIADISQKYGIQLSNGGGVTQTAMPRLAQTRPARTYYVDPQEMGEEVKIILELHSDGDCVHKENGTIVRRHSLPVNK
jgi:hypothetical protein